MRVLYFTRSYTTHDRHFLLKLAASRHEIWFLRLEDDGITYEQRPLPEGVHPVRWSSGESRVQTPEACLALMPAFEALLADIRPDLVHAGPVPSCAFMAAVADARPLMAMSWGSDILVDADRDEMGRWLTCYTLSRSDMLLCDCDAVRRKVQGLVPFPDDRIVQFPWGIDLSRFQRGPDTSGLRERLGWAEATIVLSTRSWEPIYGIDVLLEAFRLAVEENPRLRLLLVGDGPLGPAIEGAIAAHRLGDMVHRPGRVPHTTLNQYFRAADVYVSCAYSDGSSISLLEALATGLPVVVTDAGGNPEWVTPEVNGWLARAGEAGSFAAALLAAAALDGEQRARMAEVNRRVAEERADWDRNVGRLLEAYDRVEAGL